MNEATISEGRTRDYAKFRILIDNRDTSRSHINKLKEAMRRKPQILEAEKILVNENMEIIDGQHRFYAGMELDMEIPYIMMPGLTIDDARRMNMLQRRWTFDDYARSYAKVGNPSYVLFLKLREEYSLIKNQTIVMYMLGHQSHDLTSAFRTGEFVMEQEEDDVREMLVKATQVAEIIQVPFSHSLAVALLDMLKNEDFNFEHFITNLEKKPETITRGGIIREYMRQIEDVYNFHAKTLTRLF